MNRGDLIGYVCLWTAIFASTIARAEQPLAIPPDVASIVTGGKWKSDGASGTFRVVVQTGGYEHILSQAQVDWITDPTGRDDPPRVLASAVAETGSWRLDNPRIVQRSGSWHVEFQAIETHFTRPVRGKWVIDLGKPGQLKATLRGVDLKAILEKP